MRLISIITLFALSLWPRLSPAAPVPPGPPADIVSYGPVQPAAGWLLVRDRLFFTVDDGATWRDIAPSLEGAAFLAADFLADGTGWLAAVRAETEDRASLSLGHTSDFGATWRWAPFPLAAPDEPDPTIAELSLHFDNAREGKVRVHHVSSSNFERRSEWRTTDGGETWTRIGKSDLPGGNTVPPSANLVFLPNGKDGWSLERRGQCAPSGSSRTCVQQLNLRASDDGGQTWRDLLLPSSVTASAQSIVPGISSPASASGIVGSRTMIGAGQGFDKCEVPTLAQLSEWRWASPYSSVNLYIGGSMRACSNAALSADYLRTMYNIGWSFIPTWVGPQAPCTTFRNRISYDTPTAQSQGWSEANAAADVLSRLDLIDGDRPGSIAYYDMEAYNTGEASCNAAVQAFISGWDQALRSRGHLAGVYATGSTLRQLANVSQPPDAVWAAHWIDSSYNPGATVLNVYGLSDDVWSNHQRLRQYAGGHPETWGSIAMNIDSNVLDGPVALAGVAPATSTPAPTASATPTATPTRAPFTPRAWIYVPLVLQEQ